MPTSPEMRRGRMTYIVADSYKTYVAPRTYMHDTNLSPRSNSVKRPATTHHRAADWNSIDYRWIPGRKPVVEVLGTLAGVETYDGPRIYPHRRTHSPTPYTNAPLALGNIQTHTDSGG